MTPLPASESPVPSDVRDRKARFGELRAALSVAHRNAAPEAFVRVPEAPAGAPAAVAGAPADVLASGLGRLDAAIGGGFPRGAISTLEGGAGASAVALRLLARGTARGLAALVELPAGAGGRLLPAALAAAGIDLERLLVVAAADAAGVSRAVDILLRSAAFNVIVMPPVVLAQTVWTRLTSLAHRADCVLLVAGGDASPELRFFATLRVKLRPHRVRWSGGIGIFATLAGIDVEATVMKHKRAAPGKIAAFSCATFEGGPPLLALRDRILRPAAACDRGRDERRVLAG